MTAPRITVLIPTRERAGTLKATLKTCIEQDYDNLEIIVSDNDSKDNTKEVILACNDPRVRYINPNKRLSMTSNFEFGLNAVKPGYVTAIGDDDGLMPGAVVKVAGLICDSGMDAIVSNSLYYAWPDFPLEELKNHLLIRDVRDKVDVKDGMQELRKLISFSGGEHKYVWGLPGLYRGFVNTKIIDRAKINGKYFHSFTPDAYSAIVNSLFVKKYLFLNYPLSIEGVSGRSNGASSLLAVDAAEENRFLSENDIACHKDIVNAPSAAIALAEAYLQVRDLFPKFCTNHNFDIARVCSAALKYSVPKNRSRIQSSVDKILALHGKSLSDGNLMMTWSIVYYIRRLMGVYYMCEINCAEFGVSDVYQASCLGDFFLRGQNAKMPRTGLSLIAKKIARIIARKFDK